ncbi:hypothetical protein SS50377_21066 [Spironucleus salmonicida]|uniref:Uncharacterized protein n=1 Tax=Spironucleus salmonicida TaxID=348837 RepID=V6LHG0_9EUKA|nr:hypothetical protein SS50377_21066 [Spironucleus salmonicida]|eukprot:EST43723.1 Hypothetical protein SS50377_16777 [Spironucleus salmonicida]
MQTYLNQVQDKLIKQDLDQQQQILASNEFFFSQLELSSMTIEKNHKILQMQQKLEIIRIQIEKTHILQQNSIFNSNEVYALQSKLDQDKDVYEQCKILESKLNQNFNEIEVLNKVIKNEHTRNDEVQSVIDANKQHQK